MKLDVAEKCCCCGCVSKETEKEKFGCEENVNAAL